VKAWCAVQTVYVNNKVETKQMKAIVIEGYGDKNVLIEKNIETPSISENQVLVEVHALLLTQLTGR
jgi:hypothetical protein